MASSESEIEITAPYGYVLTHVEFDYSASNRYKAETVTANPASTTDQLDGDPCVWTGRSGDVSFHFQAPNNEGVRIKELTIYYDKAPDDTPDAPILVPPGGTYVGSQQVQITNTVSSGVQYYYRKAQNKALWEDGDKDNWAPYNGSINMDKVAEGQQWLSVVAVNSTDPTKLAYTYEQYFIQDSTKAESPSFSLDGGTYKGAQSLTLSTTQSDVTLFYRVSNTPLDMTKPVTDDQWQWQTYDGPVTIASSSYVYAYSDGDDYKTSDIVGKHYTIEAADKPQPGISFPSPAVTISWSQRDNYHGQQLTNPNGVQVAWSMWGVNADNVARLNPLDGTVNIIGSGTVYIAATYMQTPESKYSTQVAVYTLTINPELSDSSMTFISGTTEIATVKRNTTNNVQTVNVPDGVVIKLVANGFPSNCIILGKVSSGVNKDGYPSWDPNKSGSMRNTEETDDNGYYTLSNFQYLDRGIPIYKTDEKNQQVTLQIRVYNPDRLKNAIGEYFLNLNVEDNANRPNAPEALPVSDNRTGDIANHTKLSLSESSTVQGEAGATVYAKYSNGLTYTPRELLAENNVSQGTGKIGIYSTVLHPERRTTALQVRHNQLWNGQTYDVASDIMSVYYYFVPNRKTVRLEAINNPIRRDLTDDAGNLTDTLHVRCYVDGIAQTDLPKGLKYYYTSSDPSVVSVSDDGVVTMLKPGSAIITVVTPKKDGGIIQVKDNDYKADPDDPGYEPAEVSFNIYVTDVNNQVLIPPTFSPATDRDYYATFKATVVANEQGANVDNLAVGNAYYVLVDNADDGDIDFSNGQNITSPDASVIVASGHANVNGTKTVDIPAVHKDGTPLADGDSYTIYAVTYNPDKDSNKWSTVSSVTFTYRVIVVDPPVLTPGIPGSVGDEQNLYSFVSDSLVVTASTTSPGAQVYYTINSAADGVFLSNSRLYSGDTKIVLKASAIVRAVAYYDGVYSTQVTYLYRKAMPNINTPTYIVNGEDAQKDETAANTYSVENIDREAKVFIHCNVDVMNDGNYVDVCDTNASYYDTTNGYVIYYTTDGTWPTSRSQVYDPRVGLTFDYSVTIRAFCKNLAAGATSLSSQLTVGVTNGVEVWVADTTTTCKGGVLGANIISRRVDNVNQSTAPHDITITLGQDGQKWGANDVIESYKGNRIDDYGNIDIIAQSTSDVNGGRITDADDELGVLYNHSYAQLNDYSQNYNDTTKSSVKASTRAKGIYESTFKLPSHGTFVKFEPEKDGEVTIWCEQNGGMHFSNGANSNDRFYNHFIRKRPAYFVDEQGHAISATSIRAAGTLNNRWTEISRDELLGMGGIEDGLPQTLFSREEAVDIYDMYNDKIAEARKLEPDERHLNRLIVELNDGRHQKAASAGVDINDDRGTEDYVIDGTGYCIPSASYMKYTFPVRAGKTYFFFAVKTKIGISALGFKPTEDSTQRQNITLDEGSTTSTTDNEAKLAAAIADGHTCNVTVKRSLTSGKWAAMVLPFSMSASQVSRTFGEGTIIQHYYGFDEGEPVSYINLAQHDHQMIVAGTPFFICPTLTMSEFTVDGVQIEKTTVDNVGDQKNGSNVVMTGTYDFESGATPLYGFYVQSGRLVQARSKAVDQKSTRAWLEGLSRSVNAKVGFRSGDEPTNGITVVDGDSTDEHNTDDTIYSINGIAMGRGDETLDRLQPGLYIYHGKKIVVGYRR